jgi:pPIWI RE three-gene island domain Z
MRDVKYWRRKLNDVFELFTKDPTFSAEMIYEVEIGLSLLKRIAPDESISSLWVFLDGQNAPFTDRMEHQQAIFNVRQILYHFRSPYQWEKALKNYRKIPENWRGYEIADKTFRRRETALARDRYQLYEDLLTTKMSYETHRFVWAKSDQEYWVSDRKRENRYGVKIPESVSFETCARHQLTEQREAIPLEVAWSDLLETARWMDGVEKEQNLIAQNWRKRLIRVDLKTFSSGNHLSKAKILHINGLAHFAGMVSSGKSTLMTVLAIWAARQNIHVTLLVNDVVSAMNRAQEFNRFPGVRSAPILGSDRAAHLKKLHQILSVKQKENLLTPQHDGFRWLSTACPLDALRQDTPDAPFPLDFRPCSNLKKSLSPSEREKISCSFFPVCPYHNAARELVGANIWLATPASLVYTRVPMQINTENVRFAELVAQKSDLVIIDEADLVQVQLDEIFSPHQVLFGSESDDAWLDRLERQVGERTEQGRSFVNRPAVTEWRQSFHKAQDFADLIYRLLRDRQDLRDWLKELKFFTDLTLFSSLAKDLDVSNNPTEKGQKAAKISQVFNNFTDEALPEIFGRRATKEIIDLDLKDFAREMLVSGDSDELLDNLQAWIEKESKFDKNESRQYAIRLEFALAVAILSNRLNVLLMRWQQVANPLRLEAMSARLSFASPFDYRGLMPSAPIGNALAFQFHDEQNQSTLRFFRCTAIGRWLLLNLHRLLSAENVAGPNVLLLSGTSWAGHTAAYHVQTPVNGVLCAPTNEIKAIAESHFEFLPIEKQYKRKNESRYVSVSGKQGELRYEALREILSKLAEPSRVQNASHFEQTLENLEEGRKRILLVVGSYKEAHITREHLETFAHWRGKIVQLVPDGYEWSEPENASYLRRGEVDRFAETEAVLLVAPLAAIERGHNILTEVEEGETKKTVAAIGAAYFLIRPHPQPRDLGYAVRSLNSWAIDCAEQFNSDNKDERSLEARAFAHRREARNLWRDLLSKQIAYSTLHDAKERDRLTWHLLVQIWQVVGRLVRGGSKAQVFFCDDKFNPTEGRSLLREMRHVLEDCLTDENEKVSVADRAVVEQLYAPLYAALMKMKI